MWRPVALVLSSKRTTYISSQHFNLRKSLFSNDSHHSWTLFSTLISQKGSQRIIIIMTEGRTYSTIQMDCKCKIFYLCYQSKQKGTYLLIFWMKMGETSYSTVQADMCQLSVVVECCCCKLMLQQHISKSFSATYRWNCIKCYRLCQHPHLHNFA